MDATEIRLRTWVRGSDTDQRSGLLGFISVFVGNLVVDGIALRRTESGRLALSFPSRTAKNGDRHAIVRPVDDDARKAIEKELLRQLAEREEAAP
jgi:DNA-binding cell septation regulator SpoVG